MSYNKGRRHMGDDSSGSKLLRVGKRSDCIGDGVWGGGGRGKKREGLGAR